MDGGDITSTLIPAPFGIPLVGGGVMVPSGFTSGDARAPLMSITVTDNEGTKSDAVTMEIDNRARQRAPKKGSTVQVSLGYANAGVKYMGQYKVDQWTKTGAPRKMSVSAKAADVTTDIKSPKSRSYHKKTVGEIVKEVAGKHKKSAQVDPEIAKIKIGHIDQSGESDLQFLSRLAKRVGANFKPADGKLLFTKAGGGRLADGSAAPTFVIREADVTDWSATGSERGAYESASASWQNVETGEREWITSGGKGKPQHRDRKLYKTREEAEQAAKVQLASLNRGKVSVSITMIGDLKFFAGCKIMFLANDPDVDGLYSCKTAAHTLDDGGLKTVLTLESGEDDDTTK
ncbi:hypothetical protein PMNALOAF_2773 [Methylobacterium adhaesivum]|uniref:Contractile injection system protein, VgrG/Pvc8 family n=1 Tax=Methylobacterium adhaesivum TaxID=333297 RepID=A0ABT8BJ55_9HYPH|nr:contractile injection system protein, VgrG/Pvc8 family [Methylobacterium adhaesivum]MDN3592126.1 contractile injection system protein, VgrG/Pvc8 family [Methylobacterium adhaesivum]GJD31514.1 hypothetical protein PMNALOAF_2773 [Methylobacterium adhaesivum]